MLSYIVSKMGEKVISVLMDDNLKPVEIRASQMAEHLCVGDIVIGRVNKVAWNIRAAFIDVGEKRDYYLPLSDLKDPIYIKKGSSDRIQQGDEVLVQVLREGIKTKAAALTSALSIRGRLVMVGVGSLEIGVSRRIPSPRREELKEFAQHLSDGKHSILIRTNAFEASEEEIREEYERLSGLLGTIQSTAYHRNSGTILYTQGAPWLRKLSDLPVDAGQIWIEDEQLYAQAESYLSSCAPVLLPKLMLYQDVSWPLEKRYDIKKHLDAALRSRVNLRSGAYLVIEHTEALCAIDVNTGNIGAGKLKNAAEDTFRKVNREAADQIARQIRLRDISGMILVDFINMNDEEHRSELLSYFQSVLQKDPVRTTVVDMTKLGLVEVTRRKIGQPLHLSMQRGMEEPKVTGYEE